MPAGVTTDVNKFNNDLVVFDEVSERVLLPPPEGLVHQPSVTHDSSSQKPAWRNRRGKWLTANVVALMAAMTAWRSRDLRVRGPREEMGVQVVTRRGPHRNLLCAGTTKNLRMKPRNVPAYALLF